MTRSLNGEVVPVNFGKLLENQLNKWKGGGHHPKGIAEYISNSDDSYRRLKKFSDQSIIVEIYSRGKRSKKIDKLIIRDCAEGMSYEDLENKFFRYFESFSGRDRGEKVTGQFGTGGKAYAIMNFRHCWIESTKDGKKCKAWFMWDSKTKEIIKNYNNGGFKNINTKEKNGTTVILENSLQVNYPLIDFPLYLEKLPRIRHILKNQKTVFMIKGKGKSNDTIELKYSAPNEKDAKKIWRFPLTSELIDNEKENESLILRYFEKPIGEEAYIDLTDGLSTVQDLQISKFDSRPASKYINGFISIPKLFDSPAVKENRRGLEEDDDLTVLIESFIKSKVIVVIDEIEEIQKRIDQERKLNTTNEKLNELSKFLSKQDLKFKLELKELRKRFSKIDIFLTESIEEEIDEDSEIYRHPLDEDPPELLIRGNWIKNIIGKGNGNGDSQGIEEFIPSPEGNDFGVKVGGRRKNVNNSRQPKKGLKVLMSNDSNNPDSPTFTEYDDPVSDRDLKNKGVIWINSVHPVIYSYHENKNHEIARNENIANLVLMIVAQYYAQKEAELQPEHERDDPLLLFRKHFFKLQRDLRQDDEITYFTTEYE